MLFWNIKLITILTQLRCNSPHILKILFGEEESRANYRVEIFKLEEGGG